MNIIYLQTERFLKRKINNQIDNIYGIKKINYTERRTL